MGADQEVFLEFITTQASAFSDRDKRKTVNYRDIGKMAIPGEEHTLPPPRYSLTNLHVGERASTSPPSSGDRSGRSPTGLPLRAGASDHVRGRGAGAPAPDQDRDGDDGGP